MSADVKIRWGWLKFMYIYAIFGAGGFGLAMIFFPNLTRSLLGWPIEESITYGIAGSIFTAIGIVAIFGLRSPLKFVPLLFFQLCYKSVWFIAVVIPMLISGRMPGYAVPTALFFLTYVVGDLIAIPFPYLFGKQPQQ